MTSYSRFLTPAGFSHFFEGLPGRVLWGSWTASIICLCTCCEIQSANLWAIFRLYTYRHPHCWHSNWQSSCFGIWCFWKVVCSNSNTSDDIFTAYTVVFMTKQSDRNVWHCYIRHINDVRDQVSEEWRLASLPFLNAVTLFYSDSSFLFLMTMSLTTCPVSVTGASHLSTLPQPAHYAIHLPFASHALTHPCFCPLLSTSLLLPTTLL